MFSDQLWFLKCWYLKSAAMYIIMSILKQQLESNSRVYHHRECSVRKLRNIELFFNRSFTTISREERLGFVNNIPWICPMILPFINHYFLEVMLAKSHHSLKSTPPHSFHWIQLRFFNLSSKSFIVLILDTPDVSSYCFPPLPRALLLTTCNVRLTRGLHIC